MFKLNYKSTKQILLLIHYFYFTLLLFEMINYSLFCISNAELKKKKKGHCKMT